MTDLIGRWFAWVRAVFGPRPRGRHSRAYIPPAAPVPPPPGVRRASRRTATVLDGEAHILVHPYVLTQEQRQEWREELAEGERERWEQRERRRALALAVLGVDVGPRVIHGVEVGR